MKAVMENKPNNITEYLNWAANSLNLDESSEIYYKNVSNQMKEQFENSPFWLKLVENIKYTEEGYLKNTKYDLLQNDFNPRIYVKEYTSFIDKCLRKNVIYNENWPEEPPYGWITHINAYEKIGDIVRTNFLVKYLDGVDWVIECLRKTCQDFKLEHFISYQAKQDGYYAAHFDVLIDFEIPTLTWRTKKIRGRVEIQVTTLLKEVIKKLIHKVYKEERTLIESDNYIWQWDYKSDRFIINYLGHVLHYLEGTIMEIRDRRLK